MVYLKLRACEARSNRKRSSHTFGGFFLWRHMYKISERSAWLSSTMSIDSWIHPQVRLAKRQHQFPLSKANFSSIEKLMIRKGKIIFSAFTFTYAATHTCLPASKLGCYPCNENINLHKLPLKSVQNSGKYCTHMPFMNSPSIFFLDTTL